MVETRTAADDLDSVVVPPPPESLPPVPAVVHDWFRRRPAEPSWDDLPNPPGYELRREIGRGAMGVVFEAEQLELKRIVAVKVLHPGQPARADWLDRFRAEGEACARLSHPNVVEVHGRGEVAGRPYLVMEFVAGANLADRLAEMPLAATDAARLVAALAQAIDHAHRAGVVHRDLKPANVLLAIDGTPKITDFGLAKLLDNSGQPTCTGAVLGTPAYMAPEQAAGDGRVAAPAADIYALGAVLYECLTGRPPFRAATALATLDLVRAADPVSPRRLNPAVPHDLETVCLTCLRKEPARRYATAAALADDLGRFLDGRPVAARPTGAGERLWKWCRRRPAAAALLAVLVLAVLAGATGIAVHAERLRREADRANRGESAAVAERERAAANYRAARDALRRMLGRLDARGGADIPAVRDLQRAQAEDALAFYLSVAEQVGDRPEVRYDAARAGVEAARLQSRLGLPEALEANLRRASDQFAALAAEDPNNADYRAGWATALSNLGAHLHNTGRFDDALRCHTEAVALQQGLAAAHPAVSQYRDDLATSHVGLGNVANSRKRSAEAERHYLTAVELCESLVQDQPQNRDYRRRLAGAEVNLSVSLQVVPGRADDTRAWHDRAEGRLEQLFRDDPADADTLYRLAMLRVNWAYVLQTLGQSDNALADLSKNVAALTVALEREPQDFTVRDTLYRTYGVQAQILDATKQYAESAAAWERVVATAPAAAQNFNRLFLAEAFARAGDHGRALATAEAALAGLPEKPEWNQLYHLTTVCGLALTALRADPALAADERDRRGARMADLAVRLLTRIKQLVTPEEWQSMRPELAGGAQFAPLRDDAAFRQLLGGG